MAQEKLLIVEDERIVADDLSDMLKSLNYNVLDIVSSGEEAVEKAEALHPDLILMDIRLNGAMDGVQAAEMIWTRLEIPVIYLTANADDSTLERAKSTLPFGYILKPFEERDLRTTLEIALYKHQMESTLKRMEGWYASVLDSLNDSVVATNAQGMITFMNPAAEALSGWSMREAYGKKFSDTFRISTEPARSASPNSGVRRVSGQLQTKEGSQITIECVITALRDAKGQRLGDLVVLHGNQVVKTIPSIV
jgi:PAS domain S-box-containing protein